jgi:adenosine/AMP kinase
MDLLSIRIENPDDVQLILGQSHFIKTVEDLHEALVGTCACDSASRSWSSIGAGHSFAGVDGGPPLGIENEEDQVARKKLVRGLGYKL